MRRPAIVGLLLIGALLAGCSSVPMKAPEDRIAAKRFRWPVSGSVSSGFGYRSGGRHEGIDILAPAGTPVGAAERGTVAYAGNGMRGYGNAVILDHGKDKLEIHEDAIRPGMKVLVADDVLAAGGTVAAVLGMLKNLGADVVECCFLAELTVLRGRDRLKGQKVFSLIQFDD
jgi:hypothetical protein